MSSSKNIYIYIRYVFNMFDFRLQKKYVWFQDFCTNIIQKTLCTCSICLIIKNLYFSEYFLFLWQMGVLLKKKKNIFMYDMWYSMCTLLWFPVFWPTVKICYVCTGIPFWLANWKIILVDVYGNRVLAGCHINYSWKSSKIFKIGMNMTV